MENKYLGMSDLPIFEEAEDSLKMGDYVKGLVKFVSECCTPMSIALQGDWGTGKTSFINRMIKLLESEKDGYFTVYFNTWQYSQFDMSNSLYYSFVECIVKCIQDKNKNLIGEIEEFLKSLSNIMFDISKQIVESKIGCSLDSISKEVSKYRQEKMEIIKKLKEEYKKLISKTAGKDGRVIIFIDDLDRLNPEISVALLETIKLFMDIEKCVYVLAIDYDVVVRGIRAKYGEDLDDEKCSRFFDKIIQLPFRMPTERYEIEKMLSNNNLGDKFKGYTDVLGKLIKSTFGANPRTFKRIINTYELLKIVGKKGDDPFESTLLLINLIFQMYAYDYYVAFLDSEISNRGELEEFKKNIDKSELLQPIFKALDELAKNQKNVIEKFCKEIKDTSVAVSLVTATSDKKPAKITKVSVFGDVKQVESGAEAICYTIEKILEKYPAKIDEVIKKSDAYITKDKNRNSSIFESKKELKLCNHNETIYLGVHSGHIAKINQIKRVLSIVEHESNDVKWYDENKEQWDLITK